MYRIHQSADPLSSAKYGFKYLEPKKLPPGVKIVGKRISVMSEAGKVYGVQAEINLRPVDWVYSIRESKSDGPAPVASAQNYDPNSVKPSCSQESTPKHSYRLCHWIDYGTINVYEVKFAQGGTFIDAQIPLETKDQISVSSFNSFVDSFIPAKPPIDVISGI
jgi:hypothetical protein